MNNLVLKNQITFILLTILVAITCVVGINNARMMVSNIELSMETTQITQPVSQYYKYRLSLAESNNQTVLETIINPKKPTVTPVTIANSIPVVVYHGIVNETDGKNTTLNQFKSQLYTMKDAGYQTVSLEDYLLFTQGKKQLPEKSFLLTVDDGRKDSFIGMDPVLKALDYQAVMFVITEHLNDNKDSSFYLSVNELKAMQKSGRWNIQSHGKNAHNQYEIDPKGTKGNFYSNKLWLKEQNRLESTEEFITRVKQDLADSKSDLEKHGFSISAVAFPFGDFGQFSHNFPDAKNIVPYISRDIYTVSFYQTYKGPDDNFITQNYYGEEKAFSKRLIMEPNLTGSALINLLESGNKKELTYAEDFTNQNRWVQAWGLVNIDQQEMLVGSTEKTTGGSAFLKDANHWQNYRIDAGISMLIGNTFSLHTRVMDANNYVTCDFSDSQVKITQRINGESEELVKKKLKEPFDPAYTKFSVEVNSDELTCFINDKEVIKTTKTKKVDKSLSNGTIGFSTWDNEKANSAILIRSVNVSELQ